MCKLRYVIGDATAPIGNGLKIICHVCNDIGAWGAGFVMALSKKWSQPERMYINLEHINGYELGNVQYVQVEFDITIANMIAQHGVRSLNNEKPIQYDALRLALKNVFSYAKHLNATVHMPRIGSGLAGGDWTIIEKIIKEEALVDVYVYDLPNVR